MKRKNSDIKQNPSFEEKRAYKGSNYTGDPRLVPRVKQYLEANKNKAMISVAVMAEDIQTMYSRDYGRKKKNAFKISVEKAYEYVRASTKRHSSNKEKVYSKSEKRYLQKKQRLLDSESIDTLSDSDTNDDDDDDDKSFSSDNPDYVIQPDGNSLNDCLKNMYKKTPLKTDSAGCHSSQSSAGWMSEKHVAESGSKSNSLFVIDRRGDKSDEIPRSPGRAASSSVIKRTKKKQFTEKESVSSCSSPVNGSRSGTPSRRVTDAKNITNIQDEDPELIILDAGSTVSEEVDCTCADADVDQLRDDLSNASDGMRSLLSQNQQGVLTETTDRTKNEFNISQVQHRSIHNHKVGNDNADTKINISKRKDTRQKKSKKGKTSAHVSPKHDTEVHKSTVKFADIGGNDNTLKEICKLLVHMKHPEVYERLGITPPRGFLLHGPPGCGKTLMAHAIAGELDLPFIKVAATELISGVSGESEEKIRDIFDRATSMAPCILFIDEVDAITPKRETASKDMERRVVSQLLTCMDDLNQKQGGHVLVLGATNRPDSLDPALRRAGRFDREISLGIPDQDARLKILQVLCKDLRLEEQFDFKHLSCLTPGFVGADLMALTREAAITAVNRVFQKLQSDGGSSLITNTDCDKSSEETGDNDNDKICVPQPSDSHQVIDLEQQSEMSSMYDDLTTDNGDVIIDVTSAADSSMDDRKSNSDSKTVSNSPPVRKTVKPDDELRGNSSAASESATQTDECSNFKSVLSWLKNYPPLTDKQLDDLFITMDDFKEALNHVQPSAKREGFATIPDVTWDDVGALKSVRQELQMAIMVPVQHPEQFKALGLTSAPGILLAGPPGCGKTLLAKAIANESGINFISVKGPELLNMYVGESERAVRQVFQRAKNSAPCVIFFDELDALCPRRSGASENGASVRVVNQLLTEMDGLETRKQVFIMAATNRPDIIDPAILRPGRLDKVLYVGIPDIEDRLDILTTVTKNGTKPLFAPDVNLRALAEDKRCEGYTGADLAALVREAAVTALRCFMSQSSTTDTQSLTVTQPVTVTSSHFDVAFHKVRPSVSEKDQLLYTKMKAQSTPADVQ